MGLDITAYRKIELADNNIAFDENDELTDYHLFVQFYRNNAFSKQIAGEVEDGAAYKYEDSMSFTAGSYSSYNRWREELAKLAGYKPIRTDTYGCMADGYCAGLWKNKNPSGHFSELINFSDCDGVIGAQVSAKLANDFSIFQVKADAHESDLFREKYAKFRAAFEMAADAGAVKF